MFIGERLKNLRRKKYSQEEFAELLQVSNNTISRWENDIQEPRAKVISEMAKLLGTTTAYLLGDTDNIKEEATTLPETSISRNIEQSSSKKENSVNSGMLVYETKDGYRFEAPPTEIGIKYLEKMRLATMGLTATAGAMA